MAAVVARGPEPASATERRRRFPPTPFDLVSAKLSPPPIRSGVVERTALVQRLLGARDESVLAVVAPAGYGKSTVLAQWARHRERPVGWLSADAGDNDPSVLLTYLAAAVDRVVRVDARVFGTVASPGTGIRAVASLVSAMEGGGEPVALVLDHAEAITNRACRDVIAELAVCLPPRSQLAIGSRADVPIPVPRLRAQGAILEVGMHDLAMNTAEAGQLLSGAAVELHDPDVRVLHERTEGWPVGLYLAALAIKAGSPPADAGFTVSGDDRFMGDYLRTELLGRVSRTEASFLTRTAILDELHGPLCDAVAGQKRSTDVLDRLQARNLLLIPLDRRARRYRYHHLFAELLHDELDRREPEMVPELHRRAAAWYEANDQPEAAIEHAQQAGDAEQVARLFLTLANPVWASGRAGTVTGWLGWFAENGLLEQHPAVALHGALLHALAGDSGEAHRWAAAAERTTFTGLLPDGNTMEGSLAYLRALLCRDGPDAMRRDAELALEGLSPTSPYRAAMLHSVGVSHLLHGEHDAADPWFVRALDEATSAGVVPFVPVLLAERGIVAIERDDWESAAALADEALTLVHGSRFDEYWTSALVYAFAARTVTSRGRVERAGELAGRAAALRPLLNYVLPVVSVQALIELTHVYVALGDIGGADAALAQIRDISRQVAELGTLADQAKDLRTRVDLMSGEMLGVASLTTAELRLVPLLPTHLSFSEMADRLYLSRHTVKTQAGSIYRKIGVSSRSEAVARLTDLGLNVRV